jgi:hypothetical protein
MTLSVTGRRRRAKTCWCECELTISEILAEPIVKAVMTADGVAPEELTPVLGDVRERLLKGLYRRECRPRLLPEPL